MIELGKYRYKDSERIIIEFKKILKPSYSGDKSSRHGDYTVDDFNQYEVIMPWLKENGYSIKEFPNAIQSQLDLIELGYDTIRNSIYTTRGNTKEGITWSERRLLIDSLTISKEDGHPAFAISSDMKDIIKDISTGGNEFHTQELDEQLFLLNNTIEYLLKEESGFTKIDSEIFVIF